MQGLVDIAKRGGWKLRVATMCSGTDSPIFALELIIKSFAAWNPNLPLLDIEHVFSVEYIPWKAAFIQRNTDTTVFADVREFGGHNKTAYVHYRVSFYSLSY